MVVLSTGCMLFGWGDNDLGQIGDGTSSPRSAPTRVGPAGDWRAVSTADRHTCAVAVDNALWCWGDNAAGQLGTGTLAAASTPTRVGTESDWRSVECRGLGTRAGGVVPGRCGAGVGTTRASSATTAPTSTWPRHGSVRRTTGRPSSARVRAHLRRAGSRHVVVLGPELGPASSASMTAGAARCRRGSATRADWRAVTTGAEHTCGVRGEGTLWCWGENEAGQLGNDSKPRPLRAHPDREPHRLAGGRWSRHPHVRSAGSGDVVVLGGQRCGAAGRRRHRDRSEPTQVGSQTDWVAASRRAATHTCGVRSDGTMWCWGDNTGRQAR